ncbi:hypothetical protein JD844_001747 [Phrynosoma platyrhinos]|uniref:Uncharacterized protein n=1 Tax=Phrynosoma platyrhinos TaxID=52577 RepID=A0ABQ7TAA7_PHRPL|nr:hypothetical protein JD844_001747 [Phrynosoma platyrhinos]
MLLYPVISLKPDQFKYTGYRSTFVTFSAMFHSQDYQNLNILSQAYQHVLELQLCALDGTTSKAEEFFDLLENLVGLNRTSKSYEVLKGMRQNWLTLDEDKREDLCVNLWEALNKDFGGK